MRFLAFIVPIALAGCQKEIPEPDDRNMGYGYTSLCLDTRYVSHSGNELYVETDVAILRSGEGRDEPDADNSIFKDTSFATNDLFVESVERIILAENLAYSNLLLLDHSSYIYLLDHTNKRTRALNKCVTEGMESGLNQIAIGTYARNNQYEEAVQLFSCDTCSSPFNQPIEDHRKIIYDIYYGHNGSSNFYDALYTLIDSVSTYTTAANRNITVISHNTPDGNDSVSMGEVVDHALANNVKINVLFMNDTVSYAEVQVPVRTGGFIACLAGSKKSGVYPDYEGVPVMSAFHRLLTRNLHVYRVHLKLVKSSGSWSSGNSVYNWWQTVEYNSDQELLLNNYIPVYAKIP